MAAQGKPHPKQSVVVFSNDLGGLNIGRQLEDAFKFAMIDLQREDLHDRLFAVGLRQFTLTLDGEPAWFGADLDRIPLHTRQFEAHEKEIAAAKNIHRGLPAGRIMETLELDPGNVNGDLA